MVRHGGRSEKSAARAGRRAGRRAGAAVPGGLPGGRRTRRPGRPALRRLRPGRARRPATARLGLVPAPVAWTGVPRAHFAPLMAAFPDRFTPAGTAAAACPGRGRARGARLPPRGGVRPAHRRQALAGARPGPLRAPAGRSPSLASLESSLLPGRGARLLREQHGHRAGFALGYDDGGNSYMAAAYLLRWAGPVSEADDPYAPYAVRRRTRLPTGAAVRAHVHEVLDLPSRTSATDNGGPQVGGHDLRRRLHYDVLDRRRLPRRRDASYYCGARGANHAVALVGWDDTLAGVELRDRACRAPAPSSCATAGARLRPGRLLLGLLLRHRFAGRSAVFAGAETAGAADRIYQHDPLGWVASYRPSGAPDPSTAWFAAAYTAAEAGTLTAAGFYATAPERRLRGPRRGLRGGHPRRRRPRHRHPRRPRATTRSRWMQPVASARRAAAGDRRARHRARLPLPARGRAAVRRLRGCDGRRRPELRERRRRDVDRHDDGHRRHGRVPQGLRQRDAVRTLRRQRRRPDAVRRRRPICPWRRRSGWRCGRRRGARVARVAYRVGRSGAARAADVRLTIRTRGGAVVRRPDAARRERRGAPHLAGARPGTPRRRT